MSRGESSGNGLHYVIRFLNKDDLQDVMQLQEFVLLSLKDQELYQPASKEILKDYLNKKNQAIGVEIADDLIGFSCINIPDVKEQNLGRDIGLSKEDQEKVAHIQYSFVHPGYRGNSFQLKLIKHVIEIIRNMGFCHVLCTVSPKNIYSLRNMFQNGLLIKAITIKYGGFLRYILYKDINIVANPIWRDVATIKSSDIDSQIKLLNDGFLGFNISKGPDEIKIYYGRSQNSDDCS